jgi:2-polyprenyl-3-methyl-5-hydroxy-6-metoxy-1,4-benzoquinol methylase
MKKDWVQFLFVDHPEVWLPWMKSMRQQAKIGVRGLERVFERFVVPSGARILDVASGIGRISINLAKDGYDVVGIDISPLYLDFARKWAEQEGVKHQTRFYKTDMRNAVQELRRKGEEKFDVILNYGTAIGYRGEEDDANMLTDVLNIASPHAYLVIETVNRDYLVKHFEQESTSTLEGVEWQELRRLNLESSFMENTWRFYRKTGQSHRPILTVPVSHRVYSLHELKQLMTEAGWKYAGSYGNLIKLTPVTTDSMRMTVIGKK